MAPLTWILPAILTAELATYQGFLVLLAQLAGGHIAGRMRPLFGCNCRLRRLGRHASFLPYVPLVPGASSRYK